MAERPQVIVFDVNETLSDMAPLAQRFADVGAPAHLAKLWFASLLRDGFALTAAGSMARFTVLGGGALRTVLHGLELDRDVSAAIDHVMGAFQQLGLHPDVAPGVRALRAAGYRLVTLTNGSVNISEQLLARAGLRDNFDLLLSVDDAGVWKPARGAYDYAAQACQAASADLLLVAVHPWDIDGAAQAGLQTAWISRTGEPYPDYFSQPSIIATGVDSLANVLAG